MADQPARTALHSDPLAFLATLDGHLERLSRGHAIGFAAAVAERRIAQAGEDEFFAASSGTTVRHVMNAVWAQACGRSIEPERLAAFDDDLTQIAVLVDPDRFNAPRSHGAVRMIRTALRCCGGEASPVEAARASLHMAAHSLFADDYENDRNLRTSWSRTEVQVELDVQRRLVAALDAMPSIGPDDVTRLRVAFVTG